MQVRRRCASFLCRRERVARSTTLIQNSRPILSSSERKRATCHCIRFLRRRKFLFHHARTRLSWRNRRKPIRYYRTQALYPARTDSARSTDSPENMMRPGLPFWETRLMHISCEHKQAICLCFTAPSARADLNCSTYRATRPVPLALSLARSIRRTPKGDCRQRVIWLIASNR